MRDGYIAVLNVGKATSQLTLWSPDKELVERRMHQNLHAAGNGYPALDVRGIDFWLSRTLAAFARLGNISAIVPVGHGAAACIVQEDGTFLPSIDYEAEPPAEICERYAACRDPFALTGSPALPGGLNLGRQLMWLETVAPEKMKRGRIVTWPQFWAWRLSGVAATEVTSLGCHTDLWLPRHGRYSPMAEKKGWAERLAPLRRASDVLGPVSAEVRARTNLLADCAVYCGMHDSNAALWATCGHREIVERDTTVLSTGTWFIAMRFPPSRFPAVTTSMPEGRDCLINVDVAGRPVPSARFMGGGELELIESACGARVDIRANQDVMLNIALELMRDGVLVLPSFQKGVGPFPGMAGRWVKRPDDQVGRRVAASLYLALMTNTSLDLIGSTDAVVIEGHFAEDPVFTRFLAALRPGETVYLSGADNSLPHGALRLVDPDRSPQGSLTRVEPLVCDAHRYAEQWLRLIENGPENKSSVPSRKPVPLIRRWSGALWERFSGRLLSDGIGQHFGTSRDRGMAPFRRHSDRLKKEQF